jgi:hypothetical protein
LPAVALGVLGQVEPVGFGERGAAAGTAALPPYCAAYCAADSAALAG